MGRKPSTEPRRQYELSPEAKAQRRQAAIDRWNAMPNKAERREVLRPAFSITPGRPRVKPPKLKPRHAVRDRATGRFVRAK